MLDAMYYCQMVVVLGKLNKEDLKGDIIIISHSFPFIHLLRHQATMNRFFNDEFIK